MSLHFYSYARKGYEFIDEVARELNHTETDKAGRVTRCVLRALRNRLTIDESFQFLAQLPMALKAVYVDGWKVTTDFTKIRHISDFMSEVIKEDDSSAWRDFSNDEEVKEAIIAVFKVFNNHLTPGEFENIMNVLPADLQMQLHTQEVK